MATGQKMVVRADADEKIGCGHVMRCLALAQAWRDGGGECDFVGCIESEALRQRLVSEGCGLIDLQDRHPDSGDLAFMRRMFEERQGQKHTLGWLILDGYHFDAGYQQTMQELGWKILVIDDMAHLSDYRCDLLLNQNIDADLLKYRSIPDSHRMLGSSFVLLRREFRQLRLVGKKITKQTLNILVTMGGADSDNATLKVIKALKRIDDHRITARIIVGPSNQHWQCLEGELASAHFEWELLAAGENMPLLMEWADMAVSAGGSTTYELAALGVPFLIMVTAENQGGIAAGLQRAGAAVNCGWSKNLKIQDLVDRITILMASQSTRQNLSDNARKLVDGNGAGRVLQKLQEVWS